MATYSGNKYSSTIPAITGDCKGCLVEVTSYATILAAADGLADGDIISLVKIPSGHKIQSLAVFCGDLDAAASPALTFSVGLLDAGDTALDTVFIVDSTLGQAGGTLGVPATTTMFTTAASTSDKVLAIEVTTSAATKHAAERTIGVTVQYSAE